MDMLASPLRLPLRGRPRPAASESHTRCPSQTNHKRNFILVLVLNISILLLPQRLAVNAAAIASHSLNLKITFESATDQLLFAITRTPILRDRLQLGVQANNGASKDGSRRGSKRTHCGKENNAAAANVNQSAPGVDAHLQPAATKAVPVVVPLMGGPKRQTAQVAMRKFRLWGVGEDAEEEEPAGLREPREFKRRRSPSTHGSDFGGQQQQLEVEPLSLPLGQLAERLAEAEAAEALLLLDSQMVQA
jgi:hypothetical protein